MRRLRVRGTVTISCYYLVKCCDGSISLQDRLAWEQHTGPAHPNACVRTQRNRLRGCRAEGHTALPCQLQQPHSTARTLNNTRQWLCCRRMICVCYSRAPCWGPTRTNPECAAGTNNNLGTIPLLQTECFPSPYCTTQTPSRAGDGCCQPMPGHAALQRCCCCCCCQPLLQPP